MIAAGGLGWREDGDLNRSVKAFAKVIGYVFAAIVILFAILVVSSRLLMPELDKRHTDIEAWASTLLDASVTIKDVRVSWFQYQPVISFDGVTAYNKQSKNPVLQVQKIRIFFSVIKSLAQKKIIVSQIMLSGTDINIAVSAAGEYTVQGFPSLKGFGDEPYKNETKM